MSDIDWCCLDAARGSSCKSKSDISDSRLVQDHDLPFRRLIE